VIQFALLLADRVRCVPHFDIHNVTLIQANADIIQEVLVLNSPMEKWPWLLEALPGLSQQGLVLIFVSQKKAAQELADNLKAYKFHGML